MQRERDTRKAIKESFFLEGCGSVRIRYLGENFVLLSCEGSACALVSFGSAHAKGLGDKAEGGGSLLKTSFPTALVGRILAGH
ncbi:hypothetical protein VNO80_26502 [Phaseolus coccineus]|uniref:Uncharacterized protein n=1 Tax=Phaseolus coccineus TaxID=3886 RepID=A0AAN9LF55_PHACN